MLVTNGTESSGSWLLGELDIIDLVGITLSLQARSTGANIKDVDLVFVVKIDTSNKLLVFRDSTSVDSSGTLADLEFLNLLTSLSIPKEERRSGTNLTGKSHLSAAANINGHDVVGVSIFVVSLLLGLVLNFTTAEEALGVSVVIEDNTESSGHIADLAVGVEEDVLSSVSASVSVNVVQSVSDIGLIVVNGVVIVGLSNLTNPRADSHELFSLTGILHLEEIVLLALLIINVIVEDASLTSFLIEFSTAS
mmetsp:Transcript_22822/g.16141  ORF Transcript_22822/g.16141 Transcript_22822/m.16141 type:complete len:251 (+) Transcript_22822:1353-2105(+)